MDDFIQSFIKREVSFTIDYYDLEAITQHVYGKAIEMVNINNDTTYPFVVNKKEDKEGDLKEAIEKGHMDVWLYGILLNDLCHKGLIEPGRYYISASW